MAHQHDLTDVSPEQSSRYTESLELHDISSEWLDFVQGKRGISTIHHSDSFTMEVIRLWLMEYERGGRKNRLSG